MAGVVGISAGTVAAIAVLVLVDIFAIMLALSLLRARRAQVAEAHPTPSQLSPPARPPERQRAITRRDFFRRSLLASLAVFAAQFGGATVAFLWPNLRGGFGSLVNAGDVQGIKAQIEQTGQPFYQGAGRFYIVPYEGRSTSEVDYAGDGLVAEGLMPLYQRCVHLGCRVPFCQSSRWFECPCHGSKYNGAGEYELGPAPRGLDRFRITIEDGTVLVDTSEIVIGPPRGTNTIGEDRRGPFCVAAG